MTYSPSRKAIALLVLVFILGIAIGAIASTLLNGRVYGALQRQPLPVRGVTRLTNELGLNTEQQKQLDDILTNMQDGYSAIRRQMSPQFDQVREQGRNQIRQILTPEQLPKFEQVLQRL